MLQFNLNGAGRASQLMVSTSITAMLALIAGGAIAQPSSGGAAGNQVETVVVTGTSLRGVAPVGSSVITVGSADIDATAAQNGQQILQSIPAISGMQSSGQGVNPTFGGNVAAPIIHGLGASASNQTLVLIDGHRAPYMGLNWTLVDPSVVPPIAIQRVEVLPEGASSIYGSDAVAGVINFVTRNAYEGLKFEAQAGFADHYMTNSFGAMLGTRWDTGYAWVAYNYGYRSGILAKYRSFTVANHVAQGGSNLASYNCPQATIKTKAGAIYPAPYTSTVASTGAGMCDSGGEADMFPSENRQSMMVKLEQEVGDRLTLKGDMLYSNRYGHQKNTRGTLTSTITTANPYFQTPVSGATSETVLWDAQGLLGPGAFSETGNETFFVHPGFTYKLFGDWEANGDATIGWDISSIESNGSLNTSSANLALNGTTNSAGNTTLPSVAGTNIIVTQTLSTANALDPFIVTNNPTPASVLASLTDNFSSQTTRHSIASFNLSASGTVLQLPAGASKLAVGGQFTNWVERLNTSNPAGVGASTNGELPLELRLKRRVAAVYAELFVPVVSEEMGIPAAERIDLNISGRYDSYNDVGNTFNPKVGIDWEVVSGVKLRGSYATSFTAPQMNSVGMAVGPWGINGESGLVAYGFNGPFTVPYSVLPAAANIPGCNPAATSCVLGTSITGSQINGGNRFLVPQKGRSWSIGVDLTPSLIPNLSVSATLWNNTIIGGITSGNPAVAVNSPALISQVLQLYPAGLSPAQVQVIGAGLPVRGALPANSYFVYSFQQRNLFNLWVQGVDYDANYPIDTDVGRFTLQASGSVLTRFDQQIGAGSGIYSVLNTTGANGTFPSVQLHARTGLTWAGQGSLSGLSASLFWKHTGSYRNWSGSTVQPNIRNAFGQPIGGGDKVAANDTFDTHLQYDFEQGQGWTSGAQIYVDVQNLFDTDPPFYNANSGGAGMGFDVYEASPLGRIVSVGLRKEF